MSKVLSVIASEDFQDKEYEDSKDAIEAAGHEVITTSTMNIATGKFGLEVEVDILLSDVDVDDFDAILFVGGPGSEEYFDDPTALNLAQDFYNAGKLTTAICAAPAILANAGVLDEKNATCWDGVSDILIDNGANYTGKSVEIDGLVITADGPMSASKFGMAISDNLN
ncbi:DJ-1/PfpI family protein [Candidatus Peregrinibacteria bacterium]|nr:DJ-1/PfpI family protein [Candidatus Peregrinibacteria bacterium]